MHFSFFSKLDQTWKKFLSITNIFYNNFISMRDFNLGVGTNSMNNTCGINCLKTLIKVPACFKNSDKSTCVDLILTNRSNLSKHSDAFETGLPDFHLLTITEFKMGFQKLKPKIINCLPQLCQIQMRYSYSYF